MVQPKITVIAEHSVCLELLPEKAVILDAGCRGFEFTNYFRELGHQVLAIDIDYLPREYSSQYMRRGIGAKQGIAMVSKDSDPQARHIEYFEPGIKREMIDGEVIIYSLHDLEKIERGKFDLIKLDIEGEEYEVLKQAKHPISHQVSVEFHAHCTNQTRESLDELLSWLTQWYTIHGKCWEKRHGCGENYWDILLLAK